MPVTAPIARWFDKFEVMLREIPQLPGAIGCLEMKRLIDAIHRGAKVIGIKKSADSKAVMPSAQTMSDGSYPLARPLLLISQESARPQVKQFLEFLRA